MTLSAYFVKKKKIALKSNIQFGIAYIASLEIESFALRHQLKN